jgi:hypothetical protein
LATDLATHFPRARFSSGNADGADTAFSQGVMDVAPERMEIIAPYATHRQKHRHLQWFPINPLAWIAKV